MCFTIVLHAVLGKLITLVIIATGHATTFPGFYSYFPLVVPTQLG